MKKLPFVLKKIKNSEFTTKIYLYFSTKSGGDDFDPYEQNWLYGNLNPLTIKAYVHELTSESAYWKQYGLHQSGMLEVLCEKKWRTPFEKCNKIVVNDNEYQVFKGGTGGRTLITERPYNLIRIILSRKD